MDIERLKEKRKGLRISFSKHLTKIENVLGTEISEQYSKDMKINELLSIKSQLIEKLNDLGKADEEIQLKIDLNDMADEISSSEDYKDKGIESKSKIERNLEILYGKPRNENKATSINNQFETNMNSNSQFAASNNYNPFLRNENKNVKLPKLNIQTFYGDCSRFLDFWNSFEVAIHNNDSLNKVEKFTYLKSYLGGIALSAVSGFSLTDQNYDASIELLKERFGRTDIIMSSHMHKLLLIDPVRSCSNVVGLRKMYDAIEVQIRSLQSLGVAAGTYSNLLCPVILQKLPEELNLNYNRQRKTDELFDINSLLAYIRQEVQCREASLILANPKGLNVKDYSFRNKNADQSYLNRPLYSNTKRSDFLGNKSSASALATQVDERVKYSYPRKYECNAKFNPKRNFNASQSNKLISDKNCIFCDQNHMAHDCSLSVNERKKALVAKGLCFICFQNHVRKFCNRNYQKCKYCNSSHNSLICGNDQNERKNTLAPSEAEKGESEENVSSMVSFSSNENIKMRTSNSILLQTFSAVVKTKKGSVQLRCMLDGGANRSFILKEIAESLNLKVINKEALIIYTFGCETAERRVYDIVELTLNNMKYSNRNIKIQVVVIDSITSAQIRIPSRFVRNIALERGIELADVSTSERIHVLIGSDYISEILGEKIIRISKRLIGVESMFGVLLQGNDRDSNYPEVPVNHLIVENEELDCDRIKNLWLLETIGINSEKEISPSDEEILKSFEQNTTYTNSRYETRLLWKADNKEINSNYEIAKRRLFSLSNTLIRNKELYSKYDDIIREHLRDDIVERVETKLDQNINSGYFLPHHCVVREQKDSSKVRIVFDASSKGKGALSLNDCLESGPNLNPDLLKIILRFRLHNIAFIADIQRAYLEVGIAEEDRDFLKFLWIREKGPNLDLSSHNIETLRYKRVTFGIKCSAFLLSATIRLHLQKYGKEYERACEMLKELYVDDLINGTSNITDAMQLSANMVYILKQASMNLRRWATNSPILNDDLKCANIDCRETSEELGVPLKILGLIWDNINDKLKYDIYQFRKLENPRKVTKRIILAACGMLFDPIGIMNPFTVRMKLLLQTIWEKGLSWDESVPPEIKVTFLEWLSEVELIKDFEISRQYSSVNDWDSLEVHIFSDASPKCYGSVAYFRNEGATSFIISKSRLAPLKKLTLPRLELMGTLISARMGHYLQETFPNLRRENIFYYTDSQICLYWIRGNANDWKQFVRNRVVEIKEKTDPSHWYHCDGKGNPGDKLTRGINAQTLVNDEVWLSGPQWLKEKNIPCDMARSINDIDLRCVDEEKRKVVVNLQTNIESFQPLLNLEKYSDLNKVLRITAYILRFVHNSRTVHAKKTGVLTATELTNSEKYWIKVVQRSEFETEYVQLKNNKPIRPNSKLYSLNPILTSDDLIALRGRLQNSELDIQTKNPIILPYKTKFTYLLITNEHKNLHHSGVSDTLTQLRERFWIIRGRQAVKTCLNKCLKCKRFNIKHGNQVTAPLPANRITKTNPFEVVGIDFAGPLYTKDQDKNYIALFTCAVTRAVHLEVVSSLSTEHFLLAFRRFISRRGVCRIVNSDNALTFKSADTELKRLYMNITEPEVQNYFGKKGIVWQHIVERAAWWGGYWERMVRITKIALKKILGKALVSFEELQTILTEIEAIINSRPLTYVYNEPDEPFPLTPANFLTGRRLTTLPNWSGKGNVELFKGKKDLIKRFLYREKMLNNFWKRWKGEYLLQLKGANFNKCINVKTEFNVNDVVLIGDDRLPRQLWRLGRIISTHKGRDGKVRSVTLKTSLGVIKRPIQLLYNLEIGSSE